VDAVQELRCRDGRDGDGGVVLRVETIRIELPPLDGKHAHVVTR
jgi:hypothetical protein